MSQTERDAIASAYERWVLAVNTGLLVATLAFTVAVVLSVGWFAGGLLLMAAGLGLVVRFIDGSGTYELTTAKSPDTVRGEFLGADPPVMSLLHGRADDVTRTADGVEYTQSTLWQTRTIEYEATEDDDTIVVSIRQDGEPFSEQRLSIRTDEAETVVTVSQSMPSLRLSQYLLAKIRDVYYKRALATLGYEWRPADS